MLLTSSFRWAGRLWCPTREIPLRYAATAAGCAWGFSESDFMTAGASPLRRRSDWQENFWPGFFVPLIPQSQDHCRIHEQRRKRVANAVSAHGNIRRKGPFCWRMRLPAPQQRSTRLAWTMRSRSATRSLIRRTLPSKSITSTVNTVTDMAVSGASLCGVGRTTLSVQQSTDTLENCFRFSAHSPAFTSFAINVPQDAAFLDLRPDGDRSGQ